MHRGQVWTYLTEPPVAARPTGWRLGGRLLTVVMAWTSIVALVVLLHSWVVGELSDELWRRTERITLVCLVLAPVARWMLRRGGVEPDED